MALPTCATDVRSKSSWAPGSKRRNGTSSGVSSSAPTQSSRHVSAPCTTEERDRLLWLRFSGACGPRQSCPPSYSSSLAARTHCALASFTRVRAWKYSAGMARTSSRGFNPMTTGHSCLDDQSRHSDESMLDTTGEQKRQPIGIHPPHQCLKSERRSVGRYELQPHGCPSLQSRFGPDFRAMGADIQGV